ncbi:hypothetical protein [Glycomyces buryatensis]|uniref:WXG100 family type VII secretion target n=1 Tax=Glycomyces buryatensis TaxID=2570927 RepID=A0A4S8QA99_9ACTN|nr:hypothetical protein [Glycomyces buryatensis]THV41403.1 hypothetical protein FAB82_11420 [Glycomyces buryatensis]
MVGIVMIESARILSGAQKMKQLSSEAKSLPQDVVRAAQRAETANRGFMCADGAKEFADDFKEDMQELHEHLSDTHSVLTKVARSWDKADEDGAADFKPFESDLSGFQVPTINGGPSVRA